eukprot:9297262-Karenia_brevis.AAC.1
MDDDAFQQDCRVKETVDIADEKAAGAEWTAFCGGEGLFEAPVLVRVKENKIQNEYVDNFIANL